MGVSSRTPEGEPSDCPLCGKPVVIEPSRPPGDATCPNCGSLLWFDKKTSQPRGVHRITLSAHECLGKPDAIRAIVSQLVALGLLDAKLRDKAFMSIMNREHFGSTAIGGGLAVPHGKCADLSQTVCAIVDVPEGLDFDSLDGQPVHRVALLLSPPGQPNDQLRTLEAIARQLGH